MNYTKKEREEYNECRRHSCAKLGITKNNYNALRRIGAELHKCYEDNCNGEYITEDVYNQAVEPLERKARTYTVKLGLEIYFQTDPRGATIYVSREPMEKSNYNQGTCIY